VEIDCGIGRPAGQNGRIGGLELKAN